MPKAIYITDNTSDRESCVFTTLSENDKTTLLDICQTLGITSVYVSNIPESLIVHPHNYEWELVPISEILLFTDILYNLDWVLTFNFSLKTKTKARALCKLDSRFISKLQFKFIKDKNFILELLEDRKLRAINDGNIEISSGFVFHYLEDALDLYNNEKDIVLKAIRVDPSNFIFASPSLKRDKDIVLETVKGDARLFQFVGSSFQDDFDVAISAWQTLQEEVFLHMSGRLKLMWFWGNSIKYTE